MADDRLRRRPGGGEASCRRRGRGQGPGAEKREKRHANGDLVEQVAAEFIAREYRARKLQSTAEAESMLRRYMLPRLAGRRIGSVTRHDLMLAIDAVSDLGRPRAANKLVQLIKQLCGGPSPAAWSAARTRPPG